MTFSTPHHLAGDVRHHQPAVCQVEGLNAFEQSEGPDQRFDVGKVAAWLVQCQKIVALFDLVVLFQERLAILDLAGHRTVPPHLGRHIAAGESRNAACRASGFVGRLLGLDGICPFLVWFIAVARETGCRIRIILLATHVRTLAVASERGIAAAGNLVSFRAVAGAACEIESSVAHSTSSALSRAFYELSRSPCLTPSTRRGQNNPKDSEIQRVPGVPLSLQIPMSAWEKSMRRARGR